MRQAIAEGKQKFHNISLPKYSIDDEILYYKKRLWVLVFIFIEIIQKAHNQSIYNYLDVARINNLIRREYY